MLGLSIKSVQWPRFSWEAPEEPSEVSGDVAQGVKNPLSDGLAQRLFQIRESTGESATSLAVRAGLSRNMVRAYEDGSAVPALDTLEVVAAALGVPPGWLAYGHEGDAPFQKRRPREPLPPEPPMPQPGGQSRERFATAGARISESRRACGLSMRTLSAAAGISVQTWSNTESGVTIPKVDSLERMAVALDVAPSWLAYGDDEPNQAS